MNKEKPILMSAPMVRAIIAGAKTQARQIIKPQPQLQGNTWYLTHKTGRTGIALDSKPCHAGVATYSPYWPPGRKLWVKESWCGPSEPGDLEVYGYKATDDHLVGGDCGPGTKWKSSRFMPRRASRLTLKITDVRAERLQQISYSDAIAEGIPTLAQKHPNYRGEDGEKTYDEIAEFRALWDRINEEFNWASNPYVWVISLERIQDVS